MFKCHICNSTNYYTEYISETFEISGKSYIVKNIPAQVCSQCGEAIFSAEVAESIRDMVQSNKHK